MLNNVPIKEKDNFIDLGSGVGQVVLQVAAAKPLNFCYGIERAEVPSEYAKVTYPPYYRKNEYLQIYMPNWKKVTVY